VSLTPSRSLVAGMLAVASGESIVWYVRWTDDMQVGEG
jgi:hypothetical protein